MQIDPVQAGASAELLPSEGKTKANPHQPSPVAVESEPAHPQQHPAAAALPEPERVTVSVDASREFVYRFLDAKTGDLISQVPPEQVLDVVRGIQDLLKTEQNPNKETSVNVRG